MPRPEVKQRNQTAVLWRHSTDQYNQDGDPVVDSPMEIRVRWEFKQSQSLDRTGQPIALDAQVVVNERIPNGSIMWLGTLEQWYGSDVGSASTQNDLMEVKTYEDAPDVKGRIKRRVLGLCRFRDTLPTNV